MMPIVAPTTHGAHRRLPQLGHYDVTALIGEGALRMGQVYQATDTKLKRQVALFS